jgi:Amt family ammonium transporter
VWNPDGKDGLLRGKSDLFVEQVIGVAATAVYSVVVTFVLLKVVQALVGLRVSEEVEDEGLDSSLHGERGYVLGGAGGGTIDKSES